jgi:hypothetical protein
MTARLTAPARPIGDGVRLASRVHVWATTTKLLELLDD